MDELTTVGGLPPRPPKSGKGDELDLGEIIRLFLRHKLLLAFLVVVAIITASLEHVSFPSFRVSAAISVQSPENNFTQALSQRLSSGLGSVLQGESTPGVPEKYFQRLGSFDFYLEVAKRLRASKEFDQIKPELFLRKGLFETIRARVKKAIFGRDPNANQNMTDEMLAAILAHWTGLGRSGTDNILVTVTTSDPALSLLLVNLVCETGVTYITDHELKELNDGEKYLKIQLDEAEREIKNTDATITEFKRNNQLLSMDLTAADSVSVAADLRRQLDSTDITLAENNQLLKRLHAELDRQRAEHYGEDLRGTEKSKFGVAQKIADLERENQYLEARRSTVRRVLDELIRNQDPHVEQKIFDLRKKVELQYGLYQELKKQSFQLEMERIFVKNRVRFFEHAREFDVTRSLSLNRKIMIACVIALVLGGFGAYLWELIVPRIKSRNDLDDLTTVYLGGIPDLTRIPAVQRVFVGKLTDRRGKPDKASAVLCRFDMDTPASMSFKHIRTRILHLSERGGERQQILSVHSAQLGEGKSFVSTNLASCIAHLKRKVLLIDCDLRRGTTSEVFQLKNLSGLSEVLSAEEKFGAVVRKNVLPLLDLLPSGRSNHDATELIASGRFTELLDDLRSVYDYILLDTPPVILVPDSSMIAQHADMVLMIADCNNTTKENLSAAIETILHIKQKRIYSILNHIEGSRQDYVYVVPDRILESRAKRTTAETGSGETPFKSS